VEITEQDLIAGNFQKLNSYVQWISDISKTTETHWV
jgi:hypothetical protein